MRSYDQYCGLARALDVVGDRWTLLVVRELAIAPRRYGELLDGLPGIATNLLAERLRTLEEHGLVARSGPARSATYALTDRGRALEPAVLELARWGGATLVERRPDDAFRPAWLVVALRSLFADPHGWAPPRRRVTTHGSGPPAKRPPLVIELDVEGGAVHVTVDPEDGHRTVAAGPAAHPQVVLAADGQLVLGIVSGLLPFDAFEVVAGAPRALARARRALSPTRPLIEPASA